MNKTNNNLVYVDRHGHIGPADKMHIINLNDYSQEAQDAFWALESGDVKAISLWAIQYGNKEEGAEEYKGQVYTPRGWSSVLEGSTKEHIEEIAVILELQGYSVP